MTAAEEVVAEYLGSETLMRGLMIRLQAEGFAIVPRVATKAMIRASETPATIGMVDKPLAMHKEWAYARR